MKPVKHIKIKNEMKVNELVSSFGSCGFNSRKLSEAVNILEKAIKEKCKIFFGLAGAMVPGGMKQVVIDAIKQGYIDVLVITGANLTHDIIEAIGFKHYIGNEKVNDTMLHKKGLDRIYNVFMKSKSYLRLENFFTKHFDVLSKANNPREFLWKLGQILSKGGRKKARGRESILSTCYKYNVPIFCPALTDSGIGLMIWSQTIRKKKINLDFFADIAEIIEIAWQTKKTAVFYVGGGVPKNFIQQTMQFTRPASYGIQITTDRQEPGGSSGASLKEGISWGKLHEKAKFVDVYCDATIALPLICASLKDRLKNRKIKRKK